MKFSYCNKFLCLKKLFTYRRFKFHNRLILFAAVTLQFVSHSFLDYHDPTIGKIRWHNKNDSLFNLLPCRGLLSATGDNRWRASTSRHPRYRRSSRVHGYAGPVHEMRRRLHHLLLDMRSSQLSRSFRISKAHRARETDWRHSTGPCRQQTRSPITAKGFSRRGKSARNAVRLSILWNVGCVAV